MTANVETQSNDAVATSRIGRKSIPLPQGVTLDLKEDWEGLHVTVKGPKGTLERTLSKLVEVTIEDNTVHFQPRKPDKKIREKPQAHHGLVRTIVANMVQGVVEPFKKSLEIHGVGYRAELQGNNLKLQVGLSHDVNYPIPETVQCQVEKQTVVHLTSVDKELVGRVAAEIRGWRPCEPYKGKGIKYVGERIRRKEGKTGT